MNRFVLSFIVFLGCAVVGICLAMFGHTRRQIRVSSVDPSAVAGVEPPAVNKSAPGKTGCADWDNKVLKTTNARNSNMQLNIGLGRMADGRNDEISFAETTLTADVYTPDVLGFPTAPKNNGAEFIRDNTREPRRITDGGTGGYKSQPWRQVLVPEALVDIVVADKWEYELRFYRPKQIGPKVKDLYTVRGAPYAIYRFRNPNPPEVYRLEISIIKNGKEDRSEYEYDAETDTWLFYKNGVQVSRKTSAVNLEDPCERIEVRVDTDCPKACKRIRVYRGFPWGQELVKNVDDALGEPKTTTFTYFMTPNQRHYGFLKTTTHPDGSVELHNQ